MVGVGAQGTLRFLISLLVGRIAGPPALGLVQTAISTALLLALFWPTSAGSAASKFLAQARGSQDLDRVEAVARHLSIRTVQSTLLLAALSIPIWMFVVGGSLRDALFVASLVMAYSAYNYTRGVLFGVGKVPRAAWWDVVSSVVGIGAVLLALLAGARTPVLLLPLALAYGIYAAMSWPRHARAHLAAEARREIDGFVLLGVAGTVASTGFVQVSMVAASRVGQGPAGQYAAALNLATPASLLAGSLSLVLFPALAERWGSRDVDGFRRQTDLATRALFLVMVSVFGTLMVMSQTIVALIWGAPFAPAARVLPVLMTAILLTTLAVGCNNSLSTRSQRGMALTTSASLAGLVVGVVSWVILAPRLGVMGVAIGYVIGALVIGGVPLIAVWRMDGHHWGLLVARLPIGLALAAAMLLAQERYTTSLWWGPAAGFAFLTCWLALMWPELRVVLRLVLRRSPR